MSTNEKEDWLLIRDPNGTLLPLHLPTHSALSTEDEDLFIAVSERMLEAGVRVVGLRAWTKEQTESKRMAVLAMSLAEFDGAEPPPDDDPVAFEARVAQLVADHVEPARSNAYDQLGDGRRALSLAVRWVRPKLLVDNQLISRR